MFAREEYAKAHPDLVAKVLAVYLHAISWIHAHPEAAESAFLQFNREAGNDLTPDDARTEVTTHPAFVLEQQLKLFDRSRGSSTVVDWFNGVIDFMRHKGSIDQAPDPKLFATDDFLRLIVKDAKLRRFADGAD